VSIVILLYISQSSQTSGTFNSWL